VIVNGEEVGVNETVGGGTVLVEVLHLHLLKANQ